MRGLYYTFPSAKLQPVEEIVVENDALLFSDISLGDLKVISKIKIQFREVELGEEVIC